MRIIGWFVFSVLVAFGLVMAWNWYSPFMPTDPELRPYVVEIMVGAIVVPALIVALLEFISRR